MDAFVELLLSFLKSIPIFDRWFSRSVDQKVDDAAKVEEEARRKFEERGRPE